MSVLVCHVIIMWFINTQTATLLKMYIRHDLSFYYINGGKLVLVSHDSQLTDLANKTLFIATEVRLC